MDGAVCKLFGGVAVCGQDYGSSATLEVCEADSNDPAYFKVELEDVIITSVRPSGTPSAGDPVPTEEITLNYGTIEWTYVAADGNTIYAGWDANTDTPIDPCGYLNPVIP